MKWMHTALVATGLFASLAVFAQPSLNPNMQKRLPEPYVNEVLKANPALKISILGVLGENGLLEDWVVRGFKTENIVVTPIKTFESGHLVITGTFCEPHNCGDTQWTFAYEPKTQALLLERGEKRLSNAEGAKFSRQLQYILNMSYALDAMNW